jgi:hypothetical protein
MIRSSPSIEETTPVNIEQESHLLKLLLPKGAFCGGADGDKVLPVGVRNLLQVGSVVDEEHAL